MMSKKNYGVIQEQGFVAGYGLGFSEVKEKDLGSKNNNLDDNKKKNNESKDSKKKS